MVKLMLEYLRIFFTIKTKTNPKQTLEEENLMLKNALTQQGLFFKQTTRRVSSLLQELAQATKTIELLRKETQDMKARHRHDVIAALLEDINFKDDESRNNVIQIWDKSGMDFEAIKHMAQTYREADRMREREKRAETTQKTSEKQGKMNGKSYSFIK